MPKVPPALIKAYAEMYRLTEPECAHVCRAPRSCCSPEYGNMAVHIMRWYGVTPPADTRSEVCRFMGDHGCIAEPHFRPSCTLHTCAINSLGFKPGDPAWTKRYFKLRARIDAIEGELPPFELEGS